MPKLHHLIEERPDFVQHRELDVIGRRQPAKELEHLPLGPPDVESLGELDQPNRSLRHPFAPATHRMLPLSRCHARTNSGSAGRSPRSRTMAWDLRATRSAQAAKPNST